MLYERLDDLRTRASARLARVLRDLGRDSRLTHNQARPLVVPVIVEALALLYADRIGADPFGGPNLLNETVDEAQERSEMAWRLLVRRCPTRWMTLVGDVAQTGDPAGTTSWQRVLGPHLGDRWRLEPLTLNYRVPAEIMAVASDVLAAIDPSTAPPRSVRETGLLPWHVEVPRGELPERLGEFATRQAAGLGERRLAVIVPETRLEELGGAVTAVTAPAPPGERDRQVTVLTTRQAKGLEFDSVLIAEPAQIIAESPRGLNDLYVALTRATQCLGVVHTGELPAVLSGLVPLGG